MFGAISMNNIKPLDWWGNTWFSTTLDNDLGAVKIHLADGQTFGRTVWE
jgi:hypothetical protein